MGKNADSVLRVGDLVSRARGDLHRVESLTDDGMFGHFRCVRPDLDGIYTVDNVEYNKADRYTLEMRERDADGWVSVAERLPPYYYDTLCDEGEQQRIAQVLICTRWHEFAVAMRARSGNGPPTWDCDDERINVDEITHWMPLPEPPK